MSSHQLTGTWRLLSSEARRSTGEVSYPLGEDCLGILMYDEHGNMAAQLMRPDRPAFQSGDLRGGTLAEIKAAFEGYVAYYGAYEIDEAAGTVAHTVQASLFPNWVRSTQVRHFALDGDRLTLSTPPMPLGGDTVTAVLTWERVT